MLWASHSLQFFGLPFFVLESFSSDDSKQFSLYLNIIIELGLGLGFGLVHGGPLYDLGAPDGHHGLEQGQLHEVLVGLDGLVQGLVNVIEVWWFFAQV